MLVSTKVDDVGQVLLRFRDFREITVHVFEHGLQERLSMEVT